MRDQLKKELLLKISEVTSTRQFFNRLRGLHTLKNCIAEATAYLPKNSSISEGVYHVIHNLQVIPPCKLCGSPTRFKNFTKGYGEYCSIACVNRSSEHKQKANASKKIQYENGTIQEKRRKTCIERYGVDNPNKDKAIREKIKRTCIEKYGVDNPSKSFTIQQKMKKTCMERYGVNNIFKDVNTIQKIADKNLKNFYTLLFASDRLKDKLIPLFTTDEYQGVLIKHPFKCLKCSNVFDGWLRDGKIPKCPVCDKQRGTSNLEKDIVEWLKSLDLITIEGSKKIIAPYEVDIYLPDHNLAIEFNGLYWHKESNGKDKNYHLNKTNLCEEKGITLIHIFEDEWLEKQRIVKSVILNKLGLIKERIYARKCEIREVSNEDAFIFLLDNHLQETIYSKYNYGLYYNDELVYLVCLSKPRFTKAYDYELIRSCGKLNTSIVGGFNKLTNHVTKELNSTSLISYVDKRYFGGSGYTNWEYLKTSQPNYFYTRINGGKRESRLKFQKHKLKSLFPNIYDESLTEFQIMQLADYDRIWDCGNLVYELNN